ncbi:MAG TPA: class I SAM-dependent methyltransferase [Ilumatobacteraceae bacterium]|nr:class I SAM-dependent methyltransferase [Ilumatobacteraceae bacterium]
MTADSETSYGRWFYEYIDSSSKNAADAVVPAVLHITGARSVVDVGCGTGGWLKSFSDHGATDILGMDASRVPLDLLKIGRDQFLEVDLITPPPAPRAFDLAVSLEVAEHLPESAAEGFIDYLCALAPVVMFSAAIPGQGGEDHLNEQWPSYWADHFSRRGFECIDALRAMFWNDDRVDWFYKQNMLLFVKSAAEVQLDLSNVHLLPPRPLSLVHPEVYSFAQSRLHRAMTTPLSLSALLRQSPRAARSAVKRRIDRLRSR